MQTWSMHNTCIYVHECLALAFGRKLQSLEGNRVGEALSDPEASPSCIPGPRESIDLTSVDGAEHRGLSEAWNRLAYGSP